MDRTKIFFIFFSVLFCLANGSALFAAEEVTQAAKDELVAQEEIFSKEAQRAAPTLEEKPEIQLEEEKEIFVEEVGPSFFIRGVQIVGSTVFPSKELEIYTQDAFNKELSFGALRAISQKITEHYRSRGYLTSRAYLSREDIQDQTATIRILEDKIGKIFVEGNRYFSRGSYESMLSHLKGRVFRYGDLEAALYAINFKPDRKAKAYLIAGESPETTDILIKVEETNPTHLAYEFNNRGTKLTHRGRHLLRYENENFLGAGDSFQSIFSKAEEGAFEAVSLNYGHLIPKTGTALSFSGSYAESMLVKHLKSSEVKGRAWTLIPSVTQTFVRTPKMTLDGVAAFEIKDSKTDTDDLKTSFDRLRILKAGPRFTFYDAGGRTQISPAIHLGIPDFLGGSKKRGPNTSRAIAGGQFVYFALNAARTQRLWPQAHLTLRGNGRWTDDDLVSLEQYRLGGAYTVRGYPESDASGDYGYNLSAELNIPMPLLGTHWEVPWAKKKASDTFRLVGFLEGGKTFLLERTTAKAVKDKFLLGTGFGVRVDLGRNFYLQTDLGFPIGDSSSDEDQMQVHLAVRGGF